MASQITSLVIVYSTVYSGADQRKHQAPRHWPLCGGFTGDRLIPAQMASNAENVSIWWRHYEEIPFKLPGINYQQGIDSTVNKLDSGAERDWKNSTADEPLYNEITCIVCHILQSTE